MLPCSRDRRPFSPRLAFPFSDTKEAAQLESSKSFAKRICRKYGIPTADYVVVESYEEGVAALEEVP